MWYVQEKFVLKFGTKQYGATDYYGYTATLAATHVGITCVESKIDLSASAS